MSDHSLWEQQAGWWQEGFTAGADPEYEEQILPLAREELRGGRRVLDVGTGEGQVASAARSRALPSPALSANAASSNGFTMRPRPK